MKSLSRIIPSGVVLGIAVVALTAACGDGKLDGGSDRSVFVRQALTRDKDSCDYRPETTWPTLREGTFDVAVRSAYSITLLVQSNGSSAAQLNNAHVRVRFPDGTPIQEYDTTVSGFVDPGGLGLADVQGIDGVSTAALSEKIPPNSGSTVVVVVEVTLSGKTTTNLEVTTPTFMFPVRACRGCLISFETGQDPATAGSNCNLPLPAGSARPCRAGQDEVTPCQVCLDRPACHNPSNQ